MLASLRSLLEGSPAAPVEVAPQVNVGPARLKDIPQLARNNANLGAVMEAVREALQTFRGYRGNALDKALTLRDATNVGILDGSGNFRGGSTLTLIGPAGPPGDAYVPDATAPPTPTGLAVTAGLTSIFIQCDTPVYTQGHGHDRTVAYGAIWSGGGAPTFSSAVKLFEFQGDFGAYPTETGTLWCIWIKWLSMDAVLSVSPAGGTNGAQATTALVNSDDLAVNTIAAGTAFITDAKIAAVSAGKLTVGDGTVGGNLKSSNYNAGVAGWLLTPAGYFEAQNAMLRGTVYASAGLIGGITIAADAIRSGQTAYDTGTGFWIGANGSFSIGNSAGNKITWNGTVLNITGGGTFSGALSAASGTFAGTLTAGAVNAVNTINLAGQAVTIPVSAYTAGAVSIPATTWTQIQSVAITSTGAPIQVIASGCAEIAGYFRIRRGASTVLCDHVGTIAVYCAAISDTPGAGSFTYYLDVNLSVGGYNAYNRSILLLETKK